MSICSRVGTWWTRTRIRLGSTWSQAGTMRSPWVSRATMNGVAKTWADGLDARGRRGTDALDEFAKLIASTPTK